MKNYLKPDLFAESVFDIDLKMLKRKNINSLIIDIDNTLVAWDKKTAPRTVIQWFEELEYNGFKICLVSNNTEDRVVKFNEEINLHAIHRATKPRRKPFLKAMEVMDAKVTNTAVIGDQIFTDVLGGNRTGLYTILVVPIEGNEFLWTKFVRNIERLVLRRIKKGES